MITQISPNSQVKDQENVKKKYNDTYKISF